MYIILAILIFGVLIFVHELGHFLTAKLFGVKVNEFALCMGPAIVQKTIGETTYSLRCIPVGGYCAMEGEDGESSDPRAFQTKPAWQRAIILAAGAAMNFLTGLLILIILYAPAQQFVTAQIDSFAPGCPLESADGLHQGDEIVSIDGERIYVGGDLSMLLGRGKDEYYDVVVRRDGKKLTLHNFHFYRSAFEENGQTVTKYGLNFAVVDNSPWQTLKYAWNSAINFGRMVRMGLVDLITGAVGLKDMSGPVGIVSMISQTGSSAASTAEGVADVVYLGAFLAVNLAFMNLLPLPALDGGRVFLLVVTSVIEAITRRKINPKYEAYIHAAGMVLLLGLIAVITCKDIIALFR